MSYTNSHDDATGVIPKPLHKSTPMQKLLLKQTPRSISRCGGFHSETDNIVCCAGCKEMSTADHTPSIHNNVINQGSGNNSQ